MVLLRTLFTEVPYACALLSELLETNCSNCFALIAEKNLARICECNRVIYCDQKCFEQDRLLHVYECQALKTYKEDIDHYVRMLGRILTRKEIDHGVTYLCEGFPAHIKNRSLSDLMSHRNDIEQCSRRRKDMDEDLEQFWKIFQFTPLTSDRDRVRRFYCVMWINCFSLPGPLSDRGHGSSLGVAFYLNASRFDHSCSPQLYVDFSGCRLLIQYPSSYAENHPKSGDLDAELRSLTESDDQLNSLTISYGYTGSFTNNSYFPLRHQRRASLKYCYYFDCQCRLCADDHQATIESDGCNFECRRCRQPYVWTKPTGCVTQTSGQRNGYDCRKCCSCVADGDESEEKRRYLIQLNPPKELNELEKHWAELMAVPPNDVYSNEALTLFDATLIAAKRYWHHTRNYRMVQLCERLFIVYNGVVNGAAKLKGITYGTAMQRALETGEIVVQACLIRQRDNYYVTLAVFCAEMARLLEMAGEKQRNISYLERACHFYGQSAQIWLCHGDRGSKFSEGSLREARRVKAIVAEKAQC